MKVARPKTSPATIEILSRIRPEHRQRCFKKFEKAFESRGPQVVSGVAQLGSVHCASPGLRFAHAIPTLQDHNCVAEEAIHEEQKS